MIRARPLRVAMVVVALFCGIIGLVPLFGGLGYEYSLAAGLVVPSAASVATALETSRAAPLSPLAAVGRGAFAGLVLALLAAAVGLAHGLHAGFCDVVCGAIEFALTAGFGAPMGGVCGAIAGQLARGRRRRRTACVLAALAGPVGGIGVSLLRFYASPMIFAFDPFFGYFSGTLYDTVVDAGPALVTYRAASLAAIAGVALIASALARSPSGALSLAPVRTSVGARVRALLGALALGVTLSVMGAGPRLGHWQTAATIARDLGGHLSSERCDIVYPSTVRADDARLLARDCDEQLAQVEATLAAAGPGRVVAFFFRDAADKKRLMGAGDTYIAKPWRREVYVQLEGYPHPVLGHELAHVVAGRFGEGPFRIGGALGGWLPNPGLIEGIAVAGAPGDGELSERQWARAMMEEGILPPLESIFSLGFLTGHAATSYTVAGAFVRWVLDAYGPAVVHAWYGGTALPALVHASFAELEARFRRSLESVPMPQSARVYARARFERPGLFARRCPHVVDALKREADGCRETGQFARALSLYDRALGLDARDPGAQLGRALTRVRATSAPEGTRELAALARDPTVPRTVRDRSEEALADVAFVEGDFARAATGYGAIAARTVDEDAARALEVKARGALEPDARPAVGALLIDPRARHDVLLAGALLGAWSEGAKAPLANFLLGKNLAQRGLYAQAARYLDAALGGQPRPSVRVVRELLRQRAIVACALADGASVERVRTSVTAADGPFAEAREGRAASIERLLRRCAR